MIFLHGLLNLTLSLVMKKQSSSATGRHWANIEESGAYWALRAMVLVYQILGKGAFYLILVPVVTYHFFTNKEARQASLDYLARISVYPSEASIKPTLWFSYRQFLNFGISIIEKISAWSGKISLDNVEFHGREQIAESIRSNRGGIILGSHLGNQEVSQALAGINERLKLNVLVHTRHAKSFNRLLKNTAGSQQMELIQVTEITPMVAVSLEQKMALGEFVFIVGDRIPINSKNRTTNVEFLGERAPFSQGPFILASLLKCPVYTLFCIKQKGKYHLYFDSFSDGIQLPRKDRARACERYVQAFARQLEQYCMLAPLQWYNFYFYWQNPNISNEAGLPPQTPQES